MKSIERFVSLLDCQTEEILQQAVIQAGTDFGFEQTLIAVVPERPTSLGDAFLRSNFSPQWLDIYDRKQLISIDPTVAHCVARSTPLFWEPAIFASKRQKEMGEEASRYGLRAGITLPFHGANGEIGVLCFAKNIRPSRRFQRNLLYVLPALSMMRDFAFEASLRFAKPSSNLPPPALTQRELECLKWCASGKSSWEIAQIFGCSESTVNFHFGNLRHKFHATSRRQVVVKAIHCGLLHNTPQWPKSFRESDNL